MSVVPVLHRADTTAPTAAPSADVGQLRAGERTALGFWVHSVLGVLHFTASARLHRGTGCCTVLSTWSCQLCFARACFMWPQIHRQCVVGRVWLQQVQGAHTVVMFTVALKSPHPVLAALAGNIAPSLRFFVAVARWLRSALAAPVLALMSPAVVSLWFHCDPSSSSGVQLQSMYCSGVKRGQRESTGCWLVAGEGRPAVWVVALFRHGFGCRPCCLGLQLVLG